MSPAQFAVFHSDAASGAHRNSVGNLRGDNTVNDEQYTCLLFDNLDEAVDYCVAQANVPRLRLDIYDKAGKSKEPVRSFVAKEHERRAHASRLNWGIGFLVSGLLLILFDWITNWEWIWPTAVGLKLLTVSAVFLIWWWIQNRKR
ncbi:MAG: hypothetical protein JWN45_2260 [Acidobacteriaceae bacterium]|nr:hypothetical protein [Acidobacteriaceae bacterium]